MCSGKIKSYFRVPASYLRVPASLYKPYHSMNYSTFAYQEVKGVKEVKELRRMSLQIDLQPKRLLAITSNDRRE